MEFEIFFSYIHDQKEQRKGLTTKFDLESDVKLFPQGIWPCWDQSILFPLAFAYHSLTLKYR